MSGEPPRPRNWFLYFRNTRPTSNFQSRLIVFRCEEQWEAIWDTMANNWNIKNIYIANDIIWHDENAGMERKVEIKKIFDIYIKILYLPHRAECSQAVLEGVLMRWHQQTLRCRGCSPRIIVCFILISGHRILLVTRDTRHWPLDTGQQHSHSITCPITSLGPSIIFTRVFAGVSSQLPDCHNPADAGWSPIKFVNRTLANVWLLFAGRGTGGSDP